MGKLIFKLAIPIVLLAFFMNTACNSAMEDQSKIKIVCTTGMITDAVRNLVDSNVSVIGLMGAGVDPHLYKASQGDIQALSNADIIIYNGLHLEGKMGEIFEKLKSRKQIIVAADAIPEEELINNADFQGAYDPHLWFDIQLWSNVVQHLATELGKIDGIDKNSLNIKASELDKSLSEFDNWVKNELSIIDSSQRVLITAHDAFGYFGRAYHVQVRGLQGISTQAEFGLKDISNLVDFIVNNQIKAVFIESSVSERSIKAVIEGCKQKGHEVKIGGSLFSDAMGMEGTKEASYIGMVKHNVNTIVNGLK